MSLVEIDGKVVASGVAVMTDDDRNYAVFESMGDDWEQHSVWLDRSAAIHMLQGARIMYPDRMFQLMMRFNDL